MNMETSSSPVHVHTSIITTTDSLFFASKAAQKGLNLYKIGVVFVNKIKRTTHTYLDVLTLVQLCLLLDKVSVVSQVMSLRYQSATSIMRGQRYSECRTPRE